MMRSILRLVFLLLLLFAADVAFRTCAAASAAPAAPDSVIVELAPDAAVTPAADWRPVYGQPRTFAVPAATGKRETWAARPDVVRAEPNPLVTLNDPKPAVYDDALILASVNDLFAAQQYSLTKMNVPAAWDASRGDGITIAVVDTGADFAHPDLAAKFVSRGRDFVTGHPDAADDHGHGTHVSGIAAAVTNNGLGVAGVGYNARLLPVKALAANGSGDHASIASAIAWAADNGARIINLSLGSPTPSTTLQTAIDAAWAKGALIVCAAGNDASDQPSYPAAYEHCLSVVATDDIDRLAPFSNYGATVDVAAPGQRILSTVRGGTYEAWSFWDQPDSDGYFTFFQPRERLKPPANAVTWRKVEARSVADLPDALRRGGTGIYVPGLARVGLQVPWEARRRSDLDSSYAFLARREGSVIIEGVSEQRPVDWVCEALGVALPPAIQATTTDQTVYDDECPF